VDYSGPYRVRSPFGERHFALLLDIHSGFAVFVAAKRKTELGGMLLDHIAYVERMQQPRRVVMIISDGAINENALRDELSQLGITVLVTAPNSSRPSVTTNSDHCRRRTCHQRHRRTPTHLLPACLPVQGGCR